MAVPTPKLCTVPYASLADPESDLSAVLVDALGPEGLGVVAVGPVPDSARATRRELLGLARQLATLPPSRLATLEDPASQYNIGWSCGQETLAGGEADRYKVSSAPIRHALGTLRTLSHHHTPPIDLLSYRRAPTGQFLREPDIG